MPHTTNYSRSNCNYNQKFINLLFRNYPAVFDDCGLFSAFGGASEEELHECFDTHTNLDTLESMNRLGLLCI